MAKQLSFMFSLGATLASSFKGVTTSARTQVKGLAADIRTMEKSATGSLGASFAASKEKIRGLNAELKGAKSGLSALQARAAASGGATGTLARQLAQAEKRVAGLTSNIKRATTAHKEQAATIRTQVGGISRLSTEYKSLAAQIDRARRKQQALSANMAARDANRSRRAELRGGMVDAMALGATVAIPAKFAIDFEDSIARVGALANTDAAGIAALTAQARQLGRDTRFTAVQAAEGMQFLAMAGFNVQNTMAAMPGMLDLAAAGAIDLGRAADIASNILSAFKIPAKDMVRVSDALALTFTTSNTTMESLGESMKYVGPVASAVNMSLEDTAAAVGLLGNVGLQGTQAGTALRAALLRLAAPAKMGRDALENLAAGEGMEMSDLLESMDEAQKALTKIGVETKDTKGNLRPMVDVLEEMNVKMAQLGSGEKMEVVKKVFGMNAAAAMTELMNQAGKTVDEYGNTIVDSAGKQTTALRKYMERINDSAGTGKRIAKQMNDTTKGALLEMKSAFEDVAIVTGDLFSPAIRSAAGGLRGMATSVSALMERFPTLSKTVAIAAAGTITLAVAAKTLAYGYTFVKGGLLLAEGALLRLTGAQVANEAATKKSIIMQKLFRGVSIATSAAVRGVAAATRIMSAVMMGSPVGLIIGGIALAAGVVIANWEKIGPFFSGVWDGVTGTFAGAWNFITESAGKVFDWLSEKFAWFKSTVNGLKGAWDYLFGDKKDKDAPIAATDTVNVAARPSSSAAPVLAAPSGHASASGPPANYTPHAAGSLPSSSSRQAAAPVYQISVPMTFDVKGLDEKEFRKKMEAYRPEIERLAQRAVQDMEHDRRRVSHD